jgi:predicted transcriptional regulator
MLVANRMNRNPVTVDPADSLEQAQAKMHEGNFRHLPIVKDGKLVGMLSDHDIRQHHGHLRDTRVTEAMTENPIIVSPDMAMEDATEIMLERKIGGLPVVENGKLVGMINHHGHAGCVCRDFRGEGKRPNGNQQFELPPLQQRGYTKPGIPKSRSPCGSSAAKPQLDPNVAS